MAWQHKPWLAGEKNGRHRLSWDAVAQIRRSSESCKALGKKFGVAQSTVSMARTGRTWTAPPPNNNAPPAHKEQSNDYSRI
jgi:hypothetical protein